MRGGRTCKCMFIPHGSIQHSRSDVQATAVYKPAWYELPSLDLVHKTLHKFAVLRVLAELHRLAPWPGRNGPALPANIYCQQAKCRSAYWSAATDQGSVVRDLSDSVSPSRVSIQVAGPSAGQAQRARIKFKRNAGQQPRRRGQGARADHCGPSAAELVNVTRFECQRVIVSL